MGLLCIANCDAIPVISIPGYIIWVIIKLRKIFKKPKVQNYIAAICHFNFFKFSTSNQNHHPNKIRAYGVAYNILKIFLDLNVKIVLSAPLRFGNK